MTPNDLSNIVKKLCDKFNYIECPITDKAIAVSSSDRLAHVILAISAKPNVVDIAFSPIASPSEIALITSYLQSIIKINITQDFYLARDKEMYFGREAMKIFAADIHALVEDEKFKEECRKDGDPLLDDDIFVITTPIKAATTKDLKRKPLRKYQKLLIGRRK